MFERRVLRRHVQVPAKYLQSNMQSSILAKLKEKYQGRCLEEGYVQKDSCVIRNHSVGRVPYLDAGVVDYNVEFEADVCLPHPGQTFKGTISNKSKAGLHIDLPPLKVLVPRDLHLGHSKFEVLNIGEEATFIVIGSQFTQGDDTIVVVARLAPEDAPPIEEAPIPVPVAPTGSDGEFINVEVKPTATRTRKLKTNLGSGL